MFHRFIVYKKFMWDVVLVPVVAAMQHRRKGTTNAYMVSIDEFAAVATHASADDQRTPGRSKLGYVRFYYDKKDYGFILGSGGETPTGPSFKSNHTQTMRDTCANVFECVPLLFLVFMHAVCN